MRHIIPIVLCRLTGLPTRIAKSLFVALLLTFLIPIAIVVAILWSILR